MGGGGGVVATSLDKIFTILSGSRRGCIPKITIKAIFFQLNLHKGFFFQPHNPLNPPMVYIFL